MLEADEAAAVEEVQAWAAGLGALHARIAGRLPASSPAGERWPSCAGCWATCAEGGALRLFASLSSCLKASSCGSRSGSNWSWAGRPTRATGDACLVGSGWAGRLGGRRGCAGEALRLLDELTEPVDGVLVGAEVVAVQGLLGASVLLGLLLEDPRQGG